MIFNFFLLSISLCSTGELPVGMQIDDVKLSVCDWFKFILSKLSSIVLCRGICPIGVEINLVISSLSNEDRGVFVVIGTKLSNAKEKKKSQFINYLEFHVI